jgi:hypothetical protein
LSNPIPRRVGSDLSGLQLPPGFEPDMVQGLVKRMLTPPNFFTALPPSASGILACNFTKKTPSNWAQ